MQVGSSVNNRYYTQYYNGSNVKKSARTSTFEGNYSSNETVGYQRSAETVDYAKILEEKINEIFVKIQNGDTEPTYQIGSQSFTEKEWDEFLDKYDSAQEAIQEMMKEEQDRKEAEEILQYAKSENKKQLGWKDIYSHISGIDLVQERDKKWYILESVDLAKEFGLPYVVLRNVRPYDTTTLK